MFISAASGTPEPYEGMGRAFVELSRSRRAASSNILVMAGIAAAYLMLLGPRYAAALTIIVGFSALTSLLVVLDAERRLGFVNGDVLGATYEVGRLAALATLAALLGPIT
jgi:adenosylcobinamide-GDP ribazoletransferase